MVLTLDMGNTNITMGAFEKGKLVFDSRIATDRSMMEDQYAVLIMDIMRLYGISGSDFDGAILGSVVPVLDRCLSSAIFKVTGKIPIKIGPGTKTGVNIRIDNPAQLGADLLAGAVAGVSEYGSPCMIWDLGTATKVSVVDKNGTFSGGSIMPGVMTSLNSLVQSTSLLPNIGIDAPKQIVGKDTVSAMQSGIVFGTAAMIDGMIGRIENELGYSLSIVATGGFSKNIVKHCNRKIILDENLLLHGLRILYEKNA